MPKKKQSRAQRRAAQDIRTPKRTREPEREPGFADRLKKNPVTVLLGVIVIGSMILGLAAEIFQSSQPQTVPPTPTLIVYDTPTPVPAGGTPQPTAATSPVARKTYAAAPAMTIDKTKSYAATITTTKGNIKLQLFADVAPITVNNFVFLARDGFYDGLKIMRADEGWLIQTGDPNNNMTGGAGYTIPYEASGKTHVVGAVGMAHSTDPNSGSSQFYILKSAQPGLDPPTQKFTVFAQVIGGMDVLNALTNSDLMQKVTIEEQ
jgi:peptidyl-prolyl cis-trans isomerase B (cyclophilin B)